KILTPRMLSGHLQGRVLSMLSHMIQPTNILEIGTYTGYSALCLAEGLKENGSIDTIDINEELENFAKKYFDKAGLKNTIKQHIGHALHIIHILHTKYNIFLSDADKSNYVNYYNLVLYMSNPAVHIIAGYVLWSGELTGPS